MIFSNCRPWSGASGVFAYESSAWQAASPTICYLSEQYRQDDTVFLNILSAIRRNEFNEEHGEHLLKRKTHIKAVPSHIPKLYSHNVDVDSVNTNMLGKVAGVQREFTMQKQGKSALVAAMIKSCLSPEVLQLKIGANVMFTKNSPKGDFVNGTLGEVDDFDEETLYPIIKTRAGKRIYSQPMDWTVEENGKIRGRLTQLPLRLAWAITVHKSQGMSLDAAVMDLSAVFEFGQGYVALSRVRRLSGLHLLGWNDMAFLVHPEILKQDSIFRESAEIGEEQLGNIPEEELAAKHADFIFKCGGTITTAPSKKEKKSKEPGAKKGRTLEEIRVTHPNAYKPWDDEQDKQLTELFNQATAMVKIAKAFGRQRGAIRSRLMKLGLIEE